MNLLFRQRFFSWFDSYDVYDEDGRTVFTVEGQPAWGHCLHIRDASGEHIATVKQVILTFLPKFDLYRGDTFLGTVSRQFSLFTPMYDIDFCGWTAEGDFLEWEYSIYDETDRTVATVSKELFRMTDTYCIHVEDPDDALNALMLVLAIDAEKCSRN